MTEHEAKATAYPSQFFKTECCKKEPTLQIKEECCKEEPTLQIKEECCNPYAKQEIGGWGDHLYAKQAIGGCGEKNTKYGGYLPLQAGLMGAGAGMMPPGLAGKRKHVLMGAGQVNNSYGVNNPEADQIERLERIVGQLYLKLEKAEERIDEQQRKAAESLEEGFEEAYKMLQEIKKIHEITEPTEKNTAGAIRLYLKEVAKYFLCFSSIPATEVALSTDEKIMRLFEDKMDVKEAGTCNHNHRTRIMARYGAMVLMNSLGNSNDVKEITSELVLSKELLEKLVDNE